MRALPRRRGAAWIAAAGTAAIIAGLAACGMPVTSQGAGASPVNLAAASTAPVTIHSAPVTIHSTPVTIHSTPVTIHSPTANPAATTRAPCPPLPKAGLKLNPRFPLPKPPRGSIVVHPDAAPGCAYILGYSDVRKQNGAALVGPGLVNIAIGPRLAYNLGRNYFQEDSAAVFDYQPCRTCRIIHALPPARATFLDFGFMPVSATLQLTEIGTVNIIGLGTASLLTSNTSWSLMELRVSDVTVNGQPLQVGSHCQTTRPLLIKLTGVSTGQHPYSLQGGGPLSGEVTIPEFTGCGVTENLDPLLTGTVSGPGNFAKFTQGGLCTPVGDIGCPPRIPKPLR